MRLYYDSAFTCALLESPKKDKSASKPQENMVIPIGSAVFSPAIPTSGAVAAPSTNGNKPNNADALPAICDCVSIASENDDVVMIPIDETKKKIERTTAKSGP